MGETRQLDSSANAKSRAPSEASSQAAAGQRPAAESELLIELLEATIGALHPPFQPVLRRVNWRVARGDFWAVGGLEASGKSALLTTAAGLMRPLEGRVRLFGHDLADAFTPEALQQRLRVALVFEGGRLLRHLTLAQNIGLPLHYHQGQLLPETARQERVQALLEWAGLSAVADKLPGSVGRRLQQRTGLARALVLRPEVLLLDNPLSGLDPRDAGWWLDTLDELAQGHKALDLPPMTLVVASHDLRPWRRRARQFGCLREQTFVRLDAPPENALAQDELLVALLGADEAHS